MPTCPFCGRQNSNTATLCELCGRSLRRHKNRWKRWGLLAFLLVLLIGTIYTMEYFSQRAETLKMAKQNKAAIEIMSSYGYRTNSSFMVVEGKVRNVSGQELQGVYAVVAWRNKNNQLVAKDKTSLRDDPLFNRQSSKFVVKLPHQSGMNSYAISFETADGSVLLSTDTRAAHEDLSFSSKKQ